MTDDKIAEIRARHEAGRAKYSCYPLGEVIEQLDYLHSLEQLHDKDDGWGTQLTNVVWYAQDLIESSPGSPSVAPKIWDAFIIGDFDTTLHVATDGARDHLKDAISDRATLLAEVDRLRAEIARLRAQIERLRAALEVERLRLAACDVVAMADTPESAIEARQIKPDYRSAALTRVESRVDEVIALRAENERLREALEGKP